MNIDFENVENVENVDNHGHGGFRPGAGRKRKQSAVSIEVMSTKRREQAACRQTASRYRAKLTKWIDELKWSHHGTPSSYRDNRTALLLIFNIMLEDVDITQTEAITKAGLYLGRGHFALDTLISHWNKCKEVYVKSGVRGGSLDQRSTDLFTTLPYFIITTIMTRHASGVSTTVKDIQEAISSVHGININYWPIYHLMHDKMKLSYGLLKDATNLTQDSNRLKRIGQFLIKYASALQLEKKKEAVICSMDESYVTTGHHSHYGWYSHNEDSNIRTGTGVGKRLILVHAITNDGLLQRTRNSSKKIISAELIYEAKHPSGDYHSNMDGYNFRLWINQYLFPAFQAKYGHRKRMILVLDNAPYHKERGDEYVNIKSISKIDMIDLLLSKGVQNITIIRNGFPKEFQANEWKLNGPLGPYKKELQLYMESWIKQYPELQKTLLEKLFEQKSLDVKVNMPNYHYLIYTPPYCPQVQPIELVWAYVKGYVAKQFTSSRTLPQLIKQTKEGFNGNGAEHEGVSSEMVKKMILHTHKYCNMLIDDDHWLEGSIENLKNVDQYEEADEDTEDEDSDIIMNVSAIIK